MEDPTKASPDVLKAGGSDATGQEARMTAMLGAMAVADVVKTTLGPKGMDKIIMSTGKHGTVTVTNDGATILKSISIDNAAAKILVDISKTQDEEVGDGTTTVCVLAGLLLEQAQELLQQHIHPQTICEGWRMACAEAVQVLESVAVDHSKDLSGFRDQLLRVARTTLSSKIVHSEMDLFANLAVDAILRLKGDLSLEHIQILKKPGGGMRDSFLEDGFILDKKIGVGQPKRIENAKVLIANTAMDTDKIKIYGSKVKVDSLQKVAEIEQAEVAKMMRKCEKIAAHKINCFINRQLIYNKPEQFFADRGIMAIEHADFDGIERLAAVLGGDIVSTFDSPELVKLGTCGVIDEVMIGEDRLIRFSNCGGGNACTIVLRGASGHVLDEADRSLHDALCVLLTAVKDPKTICGGGSTEMEMAQAVDALAAKTAGKKALAIQGFAAALRGIPRILAENGGYDSAELVAQLRAAHMAGEKTAGLNMINGSIGNMLEMGISEPLRVKLCALVSASEAAEMILRVDEIIRAAPRPREEDGRY